QVEVFVHAVVVVAGHIAGVAVPHLARGVAEGVPDAGAAPVLAGGAFHLVGGGGRPQGEARGQRAHARGCGVGCGPTRGGFCSAHRRVPVSRCTCPSWLWVGVCPQYRARKLTCGSESTVTPLPSGSITKRVRRR